MTLYATRANVMKNFSVAAWASKIKADKKLQVFLQFEISYVKFCLSQTPPVWRKRVTNQKIFISVALLNTNF